MFVYVGKFFGTHALKGEIKFKSSFSYLDKVLVPGFSFYVGRDKVKLELSSFRFHNGVYLVSFSGVSYEEVSIFVNKKVYVLRDDLCLSSTDFVIEDYIGLDAVFNGTCFGKVVDVVDTGLGNYVFSIEGSREILIPFNSNFISLVNSKEVVFKNVEGFL